MDDDSAYKLKVLLLLGDVPSTPLLGSLDIVIFVLKQEKEREKINTKRDGITALFILSIFFNFLAVYQTLVQPNMKHESLSGPIAASHLTNTSGIFAHHLLINSGGSP